jgi:hypothetical protein
MTYSLIEKIYHLNPSIRRHIAIWNDFIVLAFLLVIYVAYSQYQHKERMLLINDFPSYL